MAEKADIGLIGLAVMGENLVLNMERHGFRTAPYGQSGCLYRRTRCREKHCGLPQHGRAVCKCAFSPENHVDGQSGKTGR